ncbi:DUF7455 domain-containing protein [Curtobacterium citreum]
MTSNAPTIETIPTEQKPAARQFNTSDRCDVGGCGAQAYGAASFAGGELLFCGHHTTKFLPELEKQAYAIVDNRDAIVGK